MNAVVTLQHSPVCPHFRHSLYSFVQDEFNVGLKKEKKIIIKVLILLGFAWTYDNKKNKRIEQWEWLRVVMYRRWCSGYCDLVVQQSDFDVVNNIWRQQEPQGLSKRPQIQSPTSNDLWQQDLAAFTTQTWIIHLNKYDPQRHSLLLVCCASESLPAEGAFIHA